jgi:glycosyltransferase involved in cell wall biosynthesis
LLEGSPAAILVPPEDPTALAAALRQVLTDTELRQAMGVAARELFIARFELDHWTDGVTAWLEQMLPPAKREVA